MRGELVAIDLETTGLDTAQDAIIEVGAVRFREGKIIAEFGTLVNPGIPIPDFITQLTHIGNEDVQKAPTIEKVLPQIVEFVGDAPLVAHNISLDTGFFYRYGILKRNQRIDTYDLASVLLPRADRYTLAALAAELGIVLEQAHRALDDARAAALLYERLWQRAVSLPYGTLREICDLARDFDAWDSKAVFTAALAEYGGDQHAAPPAILLKPLEQVHPPLRPNTPIAPLEPQKAAALLAENSALARMLPGYEQRPQQVEMAQAVIEAFNSGQHLLVEAGTGVGKSLAYLVPALLWALNNQERVVISTNTLNLQDQLLTKDVPLLAKAVDAPFRACVMKGRGNYLCPRRLAAVRRRRPTSVDELRTLAKILVWSLDSNTGDKSEISLRGPIEHNTWQRLSAEDEGCALERCEAQMGGVCPFYKARKEAEAAHLLIVNHALLIADAMTDNRVLPDYHYLVIDEAHQLEDAVTNGLSTRLDEARLLRRLADLGTTSKGLLGELLSSVHDHAPAKETQRVQMFIAGIQEAAGLMSVHIERLFTALGDFVAQAVDRRTQDTNTPLRMTAQLRATPDFAKVQDIAATLDEFFAVLADAMARLSSALGKMRPYNIPAYDDLLSSSASAARHLEELRQQLKDFAAPPDTHMIHWLSGGQNGNELSVQSAPLHIGRLMENYLWQRMESIVLTSATLRTNDTFDYIRDRLQAPDIKSLELGSPFAYRAAALVYVPDDIPEPTDKHGYQHAVESGLIQLAAALEGRVMALFTSHTQLRQTAQAITPRLALGNITVYGQGDGSSRQALLEGFKANERAVLLGTRSFWEGVDIPGDALSALVIVRLPFAVPTDPIFAARSETYTDSFNQYALPDAILRFRQGFGRLIRSRSDRGVVVIFDSRVLTKGYGAKFIEALPDCTVQYAPLAKLPQAAQHWLQKPST
ncbi:MAG: DEAD/DEAH box helicase [Chloroflexi bacterium]|nr:DEAD/DEAH box helicase [Chloroflexota bacterium]